MSSPGSSGSPASPGSPAGSPARGMAQLPRLEGRSPESGKRVLEQAVQPPDDEPKYIWLFTVKPTQNMKKPSNHGIQHSGGELPQQGSRSPQSGTRSLEHGVKSPHSGGESPQQGARPPHTGGRISEDDTQSLADDEVQLLRVKPQHKREKSSEPDILSTPVRHRQLPELGTMSPQVHGESSQHAIRSPSCVAQSGAEGSLGDGDERDGAAALHQLSGSPTLQHSGEGTPQDNLIERPEGHSDSLVSSKKRTRSECGGQVEDEQAEQGKKLKIPRTREEQGDVEDAEAGLASKEDGDSSRSQGSKKRGRSGEDEEATSSGSTSSAQRRRDAEQRATRKAITEAWMEEYKRQEWSDSDDCLEATSSKKKRSKT